jgi:hypothetical protein
MTCLSVVIVVVVVVVAVVSVVPSTFVQVEAGDVLHQVVSGCYWNLN